MLDYAWRWIWPSLCSKGFGCQTIGIELSMSSYTWVCSECGCFGHLMRNCPSTNVHYPEKEGTSHPHNSTGGGGTATSSRL